MAVIALPGVKGSPYRGAYTDTTIPITDIDDTLIIPGLLALFDTAHTANPLSSVPVNGGSIPNIGWKSCAATIGAGDAGSLAFTYNRASNYVEGTDGKLELSVKNGLHQIISPTTQTANNHGASVDASQLIANWMFANQSHEFFVWQEIFITRALPSGACTLMRIGDSATLAKSLGSFQNGGSNVNNNVSNPVTGHARPPLALNGTGSQIRGGGFNAWLSGGPTSSATTKIRLFEWGRVGLEGSATNTYCSYIAQRGIIIDGTAAAAAQSTNTWATVDAIIAARNVVDMLTAGGKYNGDNYVTNPTTIT